MNFIIASFNFSKTCDWLNQDDIQETWTEQEILPADHDDSHVDTHDGGKHDPDIIFMLTLLIQGEAESQCQFMYTKRIFGWEVSDYSFYSMIAVSKQGVGS